MSDAYAITERLREERMNVWSQLKEVLDDTAGRERNEEERAKVDRLDARINDIDAEVKEMVAREQREREAAQLRETAGHLFGERRIEQADRKQLSDIRSWAMNHEAGEDFPVNIAAAQRWAELLREGRSAEELRTMQWDATSGSLVVPTTLDSTLYQYLEATIAAFRMPCTRIQTSTGENMNLPTLTAHAIGTQVATQNTAIGGTDPTFGQVALNAYRYGQLVHVASDLVRDSVFNLAAWLGGDLGRAIGRVIDADLVVGTGTSEPTGIMTYAGAGTNAPITTGGSLITPTVEKWIDLVYSVNDGARNGGRSCFLVKDSTAGTMRKLRDGAGGTVGAFLWAPSLFNGVQGGQPDAFLSYPVYTDPNVAAQGSNATLGLFGDVSEYVVRTVGSLMIESTPFFKWDVDQISFRGKWAAGGNHTQKSHVNVIVQNV